MQKHRTVMLVILDGWGWREDPTDNAVRQAHTPTFDELWRSCPHAFLRTSGQDVGLPDGQMGNSEVGHLNIGAGRVVMQDLPRIDDAIRDGSMAEAPALKRLIEALKQTGGACHLLGLVSPGGVHAHQDHAAALAGFLTEAGVPTLMHAVTDGRDTPPRSSPEYIERLREAMPRTVTIATVSGRYYAMDRDKRWERVEKAYRAIAQAEGPRFPDAQAAIAHAYENGVSDEFILPAVIGDYHGMRDGDGLLCFNFRADRTRQILTALVDPSFATFPRERAFFAAAVGMTQYSADLDEFLGTLFRFFRIPGAYGRTGADGRSVAI
jgi:2,3-bisphosphoglycerate-independent phosphoglycerate mutase